MALQLVESLLSVDILSVSCGNEHVVVVGGNGDVYTWGRGAGGRLGLGNEEDHCIPHKVIKMITKLEFVITCAKYNLGRDGR